LIVQPSADPNSCMNRYAFKQGWFVEHRFFEGEGETLALIDRWTSS